MSQIICDFCSSPDVHWSFPARDFTHDRQLTAYAVSLAGLPTQSTDIDLHAGSGGGWAACNACAALIIAGHRDKLARRSARRLLRLHELPMSLKNAIDLIRPLHDQFWENRLGPPVPTTPNQEDPTRKAAVR